MSRAAALPVAGLSAAALRALADLDAAPVPYDTAEFLHGMGPLAELKAAGRAFCDCKRGGEFTEWKATNWWIANNDRARGGARVLNAVAMELHRKFPHIEHADFQQEAALRVASLVPSYTPGRVPFGAYAPAGIRKALRRWAESLAPKKVKPDGAKKGDKAVAVPIVVSVPAEDMADFTRRTRGEGLEGVDVWGRVASAVTERQFAALVLVGEGKRTADIARALKVSVAAAHALLASAYDAVRRSGVLRDYEPGEDE